MNDDIGECLHYIIKRSIDANENQKNQSNKKVSFVPAQKKVHYQNKWKELQNIFKHDRCFDVLQDIKVKGSKIFGQHTLFGFIRYKNIRLEREDRMNILNLIAQLKAL